MIDIDLVVHSYIKLKLKNQNQFVHRGDENMQGINGSKFPRYIGIYKD